MLKCVEPQSLTDIVEQRIYDYLKEHDFRPGDTFHGEKELADMLQISRPMVREALSRFRMLGLLESRKRRGIVVGKPSVFKTLGKVLDPAFLTEEEQRDFHNLRLTIELGLADLLVMNITPEEIRELETIVREEESDPADFELYMECDCRFHSLIYKATGSKALEAFQALLRRFFSDINARRAAATPDFSSRFGNPERVTHRDILEAIKGGDPEEINRTMRRHLTFHMNKRENGHE